MRVRDTSSGLVTPLHIHPIYSERPPLELQTYLPLGGPGYDKQS